MLSQSLRPTSDKRPTRDLHGSSEESKQIYQNVPSTMDESGQIKTTLQNGWEPSQVTKSHKYHIIDCYNEDLRLNIQNSCSKNSIRNTLRPMI